MFDPNAPHNLKFFWELSKQRGTRRGKKHIGSPVIWATNQGRDFSPKEERSKNPRKKKGSCGHGDRRIKIIKSENGMQTSEGGKNEVEGQPRSKGQRVRT